METGPTRLYVVYYIGKIPTFGNFMTTLPYLLLLCLGFIVGSFIGVVVFRLPKGKSVVQGRSMCEFCQKPLQFIDLVPVVSYIILGAKCRHCHAPLSRLYPLIELTVGILFVLAYALTIGSAEVLNTTQIITFGYFLVLFSTFAALFYIDLLHELLPDSLVFFALFTTLFYQLVLLVLPLIHTYAFLSNFSFGPNQLAQLSFLAAYFAALVTPFWQSIAVGVGMALFFFSLIIATKGKGMGGGDVKLVLVLGLVNGWPNSLVMLFGAFLSGAIVGLSLLVFGKRRLKQTIPFGPFLLASSVLTLIFGNQLFDFYTTGILR